ncbi:unnamed protein product [Lota lota]
MRLFDQSRLAESDRARRQYSRAYFFPRLSASSRSSRLPRCARRPRAARGVRARAASRALCWRSRVFPFAFLVYECLVAQPIINSSRVKLSTGQADGGAAMWCG